MWGLKTLGSIALPVLAFVVLWVTFDWLRDADANRVVIVVVAVVVGVVGIWVLYWGMDYFVNALPANWRESIRP